ncbi:unnamed protein product [Symbiodinium necroappetens]|uniref:Uncharacterized protein n=1 Tax=Symbiodinium necroappetens TaxID=1628268 RepID=A0A813B1Q7_9DINO|nr:unnamed protein product [Symbiodinium necroappetens]
MHLKESESSGEWLTEERMVKKWKYNTDVLEYFVEVSTKQTIKHSELLKRVETMDCGDAKLHSDQEKEAGDMTTSIEPLALVDDSKAVAMPEQVGEKAMAG